MTEIQGKSILVRVIEGSSYRESTVFPLHALDKKENIINARCPGYQEQEKPICPNRKRWSPQNTKNHQSAKINSRKKFRATR